MAFHASFPAASNSKQSVFHPLPLAYTIFSANLAGRFSSIHLTNYSTRKAAVLTNCSRQQHVDTLRPVVNLPPDVFVDYFASMPINDSKFASYCMEIDLLKEKVKDMFLSSSRDPMEKIQFIYLLWQLGVSYHFETGIEEQLNEIFHAHPHLLTANDYELYTTATAFHVFRHYGFRTSSDVFNRFRDHNTGKFKESLPEDMKGILSLHEASFLIFHGEDILDEALTFTKAHIKRLLANDDDGHTSILDPHIRNQIIDALRLPLHRSTQRLKARR